MLKRLLPLLISCLFMTADALAAPDFYWLELINDAGVVDSRLVHQAGVQFKWSDGRNGYAVNALYVDLWDSYLRNADETLNTSSFSVNALKLYSRHYRFNYLDAGIGLGVNYGSSLKNCQQFRSDERDGRWASLGNTEYCEVDKGFRVGIPVQATAVLGRFGGVGLSVNGFVSYENSYYSINLTLPFGLFHR